MSTLYNRIGSFPSKSAIFINENKDVGYTIDTMMLHQIQHILVVNTNLELTGIISMMEILSSLYREGSVNFLSIPIRRIMNTDIFTVSQDETIRDAVLLLENMGVSGVPVMSDGNISGFFTINDLISPEFDDLWYEIPDATIALDDNNIGRLVTEQEQITNDYTIWQVSDRFIQSRRTSLVVNDGDTGGFLGMITPSKLFTTLIPSFGKKFRDGLLQTEPISNFNLNLNRFVSNSLSLLDIRKEMSTHNLETIPIISNNTITKVINTADLLGYLALNI
ncbi:MAG: CBS domain-containing protein [Candidatus Heimdallarchaeota archaeon]|nr:CBS domain-containing protein [Candidatus Heimdallarchaeota archaeon]